MFNLGDDSELDRLSKEAAGEYQAPGNPDWATLNKELDRVLPQEKKKRRIIFWWLLPALLVGGGITYALLQPGQHLADTTAEQAKPYSSETQSNTQNNKAPIASENQVEPAKENNQGNGTENTGQSITNSVPATKQSVQAKPDAGALQNLNRTVKANTGSSLKKAENRHNQALQASGKPSTVLPALSNLTEANRTEAATATGKQVSADLAASSVPVQQEAKKETIKEETPTNQTVTEPAKEAVTEPTVAAETPAEKKKTLLPKQGRGWSFSLLGGIDKSTVKFKYGYKPGVNAGLMIGYHFNDTWALKTGVIYTQKNYKMAGEDFTAPKGTWVSYYKLDQVEGYCRMWEVPLLLSRTIRNTGKKRTTLSAGLSSYFMTQEDYDYYYYWNGNPVSRGATYNSTDTHILSLIHLSVGFENRISKTLSLEIEPYAKIPLGGVGYGSIKLSSFGINFSVQYRQPAKK